MTMKHKQNFFRTPTGVVNTQPNNDNNVVRFDTLKRSNEAALEEVGILHAGIVKACKHSPKA